MRLVVFCFECLGWPYLSGSGVLDDMPILASMEPHPALSYGRMTRASVPALLGGLLPKCLKSPDCWHNEMAKQLPNPFFLTDLKKRGIHTFLGVANGWVLEFLLPFMDGELRREALRQNREGFDTSRFVGMLLERARGWEEFFAYIHYQESVAGHVPIVIRRWGRWIDIIPIEDLVPDPRSFTYTHVPEHVEVLTKSGWSRIHKVIKKRDVVYVRDPLTGRFVGVKRRRKICSVVLQNGITTVTDDHSLFKDGHEIRPSQLKLGVRIDTVRDPIVNELKFDPDLAWVYGLFVADGNCNTYLWENKWGRKHKKEYEWIISNTNDRLLDKARKILESHYGVPFDIIERKDGERYHLIPAGPGSVKMLVQDFSVCYTKVSRFKRVPYRILNARVEAKEMFLNGYFAGDGHLRGNKYRETSTTSMTLAKGIEYLLHCVGREIGLQFTPKKRREWWPEITLRWLLKPEEYAPGYWERIRGRRPKNVVKKIVYHEEGERYFSKFVYDLETDDGTFVAGVGNIVHHNSHPPFAQGTGPCPKGEEFHRKRREWVVRADSLLAEILDNLDCDLVATADHPMGEGGLEVFIASNHRRLEHGAW